MSEENVSSRPPSGPVLQAWMRQGLKEVAQVLPAFPESVRPIEELGTLGNPTPQMVTRAMDGPSTPGLQNDNGYEAMFQAYAPPSAERQPQKDLER